MLAKPSRLVWRRSTFCSIRIVRSLISLTDGETTNTSSQVNPASLSWLRLVVFGVSVLLYARVVRLMTQEHSIIGTNSVLGRAALGPQPGPLRPERLGQPRGALASKEAVDGNRYPSGRWRGPGGMWSTWPTPRATSSMFSDPDRDAGGEAGCPRASHVPHQADKPGIGRTTTVTDMSPMTWPPSGLRSWPSCRGCSCWRPAKYNVFPLDDRSGPGPRGGRRRGDRLPGRRVRRLEPVLGHPRQRRPRPQDQRLRRPVRWVQIDLEADDHDHLIRPEERLRIAMTRQ